MILERVRLLYPKLTKSQRKLADYIATSYHDAAFMTAARLARTVGVNEATVIRFAQRLGYKGFPAMIADVQAVVHQDLQPAPPETVGQEEVDPFFLTVLGEAERLERTARQVSPDLLATIRDLLAGARSVVVVGQGMSEPMARYMHLGLCRCGGSAISPGLASLELAAALLAADEATVLVGISLGEEDGRLARALRRARERGARTVALTGSTLSPAAQAAEFALSCSGTGEDGEQLAGLLLVLVDGLVRSVAACGDEGAARYRQRLADVREYVLTGERSPGG